MRIIDNVDVHTPSAAAINTALRSFTLEGDWTIIRETHLVSAHEGKTGNIHFFSTLVPKELANELFMRDREIFHPTGDVWS